jgi:hypothetical protein
VGDVRPDLLLLDDIEPDESNYSELQKDKRLAHLAGRPCFPMNQRAAVSLTGTVTMAASIVDDIATPVREINPQDLPYVAGREQFRARYYPLMRLRDDEGKSPAPTSSDSNLEWMQSRSAEEAKRRAATSLRLPAQLPELSPRGKVGWLVVGR